MIFMLLMQFTGCYSTRIIPLSDIKASDKYDLHSKNSTYPTFSNAEVTDGILSGKLFLSKRNYGREDITHIYVLSDSVIQINNDNISIPTNRITKIEHKIYDPAITTINATKTIGTVLAVIGGVTSAVGAYTNMHTFNNYDKLTKSGRVMIDGIGIAVVGITVWAIGKRYQRHIEAGLVRFKGSASANGVGLKIGF